MARRAKMLSLSALLVLACVDMHDSTSVRAGPDLDDLCRVQLHDSFNMFTTELTAESSKDHGALDFVVIDEGQDDWTVHAHFDHRSAPLEPDVSVPHDSLNDIRKRYKSLITAFASSGQAYDGHQLTYTQLSRDCSRDEFALIHFFVMEWFYFG